MGCVENSAPTMPGEMDHGHRKGSFVSVQFSRRAGLAVAQPSEAAQRGRAAVKGNPTPALASRLSNLQVTPALCVLALVSADQEKLEKACRTLSHSDHALKAGL